MIGMCHLHEYWSACKQRRNPLAVVTRDASNPSTGLFAKQQVAGRLGLEPRPQILEIRMLPLHHQPMVVHSGIGPETFRLSGGCANLLRQCTLEWEITSFIKKHRTFHTMANCMVTICTMRRGPFFKFIQCYLFFKILNHYFFAIFKVHILTIPYFVCLLLQFP